jgi:hypothetical protein
METLRCLYGQEVTASCMDGGRCAHLEDCRAKENKGVEHRPNIEAIRGGYSAKGIQPWPIARFTSLTHQFGHKSEEGPAGRGAFLWVPIEASGVGFEPRTFKRWA